MFKSTPVKRVLFVRRFSPALLVVIGVFSLFVINIQSPRTAAASADTVNFQARLQSSTGAIVPDGTYNVEFKLYNATGTASNPGSCTTAANCVWYEDYTGANMVTVKDGYLSVSLGSITPFPTTIDWSQQLYLTMDIGGTSGTPSWDGEMNPRLALTATPYSFLAQTANQATQAGELSTTNADGTSTLSVQGPTTTSDNETFVIQDQGSAGTYDLLAANSSGNVAVSGALSAGTIKTDTIDTASAATLTIGASNASAVSIGNTTTNIATTINGTALVKPTGGHDSTDAFDVQDASSVDLLNIDSQNGIVNVGATGAAALATTVNIATSSSTTSTQAVNIGSNADGSNTVTIQGGSGYNAVSIQAEGGSTSGSGGYISIGTNDNNGTVNIGAASSSTNTSTVNIANSASATGVQTVNIGSENNASTTINIESGTGAGAIGVQAGTGGSINIGTSNANTVNLGAGGTTAVASTVNIADTTGSAAQTVTLGSTSSSSTTTIQGGTGGVTINVSSGSTVSIGTAASESVTVGSTSGTNATTIQGEGISQKITGSTTTPSDIVQTSINSSSALQVQNAADDSIFNVSTTTTLINDNMVTTAPVGVFNGGASWSSGNDVILDNGGPGIDGEIDYSLTNVGNNFDATFSFMDNSTNAGDGTFFYAYDNTIPASFHLGSTYGGGAYEFAYDELTHKVEIDWNGTAIASSTSTYTFDTSTWHTAEVVKTGSTFNMYFDGSLALTYTDSSRSLTGTNFGLGGCSCANAGEHLAKGFTLTTDATTIQVPGTQTNNIDTTATSGTLNVGGTNASTINLGSGIGPTAVNIGNGAINNSTDTVTVGSGNKSSTTTIQGGTGGVSMETGANSSGSTGGITIETGNAGAGTAGNITIDTGTSSSVVAGSIEDDTFETGTDNWGSWFNTSVAQSTTEAHGGTHSLAVTSGTGSTSWGVEGTTNPTVTPGQSYTFSAWVYSLTAQTITLGVQWGSSNPSLANVAVSANTWTQVVGTGVAPSGATGVLSYISNNAAVSNSTLVAYVDDFTISSGVTSPQISIGSTNVQNILIGNQTESGATMLLGGSSVEESISSAGVQFKALNDSTTLFNVQNSSASTVFNIDSVNNTITIGDGSTSVVVDGTLAAQEPGQSAGTAEQWHSVTLDSSWVNYGGSYAPLRYRLLPDGNLQIDGLVKTSTTTAGGTVSINSSNPLPTAYRPTYQVYSPVVAATGTRYAWQVLTNGVIQGVSLSTASGDLVEIHAIIPLN